MANPKHGAWWRNWSVWDAEAVLELRDHELGLLRAERDDAKFRDALEIVERSYYESEPGSAARVLIDVAWRSVSWWNEETVRFVAVALEGFEKLGVELSKKGS